MFYAVHSYIVNYVAPNYLQGVSMQACKTHLVGTQKRKTHIIAGVLTILGCISGVYGSSSSGGQETIRETQVDEIAKRNAEDSFARHTAEPISLFDIDKVTKKIHQELKGLLDDRGTKMSQPNFDRYKTTLLKRYVELICDKIITELICDKIITMEDHTLDRLMLMLEGLKKEYSINCSIPVGTDTNNTATISVALKQFDAIVKKVFDSVKDDNSLQTEMISFKNFLDENKNVLSYEATVDFIIKNYKITSNPKRHKINNIMLNLMYLYTKLLK